MEVMVKLVEMRYLEAKIAFSLDEGFKCFFKEKGV
jgi:hypothetical protein